MQTYVYTSEHVRLAALDKAIRDVIGSAFIGASYQSGTNLVSLYFADHATNDDIHAAEVVLATHDPVALTISKTSITADGTDAALLTVQTFHADAEPVTVLVQDTPIPITLTNGTGTLEITSDDPAVITISVQNPDNRTTDTLTVEAL